MEYVLSIIGLPQGSLKRALSPLSDFGNHIYDHFIPHSRNNYHPHILGHRSLALMSGLLVAVKIFTISVLSIGPILPAFSSAITEENIISLTNQSRQEYGLSGLTQNSELDKAAQAKADDMLAKGYFAHNTPEGRTPWSFITAAGYNYLMAGENLAVNFTEAENVETAWMNSPGHKANILNKNFVEIGIGISQGIYQGHTAVFVVQEFGTPVDQKITLSNEPTVVQNTAVPAPAKTQATLPIQTSEKVPTQASPLPVEKTLGDSKNTAVALASPVSVSQGSVKLESGTVNISAEVNGPAVKVIAYFGEQAIMLLPKTGKLWSGEVSVSNLAKANTTVHLKAFAMNGQSDTLLLADFSSGTISNYNLSGTAPESKVTVWGITFDPKSFENRFYLFFIAGLLSSMILAIAIKRHVQHLILIANSSFVVIFATLLWMAR